MKAPKTCLILAFLCFFASTAWAAKIDGLNEAMMGENISGGWGDFDIEAKNSFTAQSREVIWFASFKGMIGAPEAKLTAEWITPAGESFKNEKFSTQWGNSRFGWAKLDIQGADKKALELEGEWTVRVSWDDELIDTRTFYMGERKFMKLAPPQKIEVLPNQEATAEGYIRLAKVYYSKNEMSSAVDALLKAQSLEPSSPSAYLVLGSVYNSLNWPERAILQFSKAQSLGAEEVVVRRGLASAYTKLGLTDDAAKQYEAILSVRPDSKEDLDKLNLLRVNRTDHPQEN